ncbi:MAG TPA: fumarylacetoacetate hydrolase family protein [Rubrivivax sp.]|nr:fumarylacetoacetate hydrolase family protein [Rubrivivax sp.]
MNTITRWVRFDHHGQAGFGTLEADTVAVHEGDMFDRPRPTGERLALDGLKLLAPVRPGKVLGLWNNYMALAAKLGLADAAEPLYFLKSPGSVLAPGGSIVAPPGQGKVVFEGEMAVVIGRRARAVSVEQAAAHVFGCTCVNDVTAAEVLNRDSSFAQWARAKSFDTFCPLGPCIATGLDPAALHVRTRLDGQLRQDYPAADMRFSVPRLVSLISHDMTLEPGDVILCGTSVGVGSMKPGQTVEVEIEGIGLLRNRFETAQGA